MSFAAQPQLVLKHVLRVGHIAVAGGDLLERWCEERCVARMTEHAAMLIHQCGRFGFGLRGEGKQHERNTCQKAIAAQGVHWRAVLWEGMSSVYGRASISG